MNETRFTRWQEMSRDPGGKRSAELDETKQRVHQAVIAELGPSLFDDALPEADRKTRVQTAIQSALAAEHLAISAAERQQVIASISADVLGYGPIDPLLSDTSITEVMCNGPDSVYVERSGKIEKTNIVFYNEAHLRRIVDKIVSQIGRRIDESTPMVDARLPDGSRVNAVVSPLAIDGPFLTIRKFSADPFTVADLVSFGTMTPQVAHFLQCCVRGRMNVIVSGGTGSGKTTMLNVLSGFIPEEERIVTVEDAKELQLHQDHVVALESRPMNIEGRGQVTIRDLVRNSLRMRPDRIVVGEVRGEEALDMLQAMNTGHDGSLGTVHSNTPRDTISRIETMTLMAGMDLPIRVIREQVASALDLIVHVGRLRDGTRRITHVTEVLGMEGELITLQDIYLFDFGMGVAEDGKFRGTLKSTGIRPKFGERLQDFGIQLAPELFRSDNFVGKAVGTR